MNTQTKSTQNPEQPTRAELGTFRTGSAIGRLFEHAAPYLSDAELGYFSDATGHAIGESAHMAEVLELLGCLASDDLENGNVGFETVTPMLLWHIGNHYEMLRGLITLGRDAGYRLNHPGRAYPPQGLATAAIARNQTATHKKTD